MQHAFQPQLISDSLPSWFLNVYLNILVFAMPRKHKSQADQPATKSRKINEDFPAGTPLKTLHGVIDLDEDSDGEVDAGLFAEASDLCQG